MKLYQDILHEVYSKLIQDKTPDTNPVAYFIAGQPGSGKTTRINQAIRFNNDNLIVINRDDFRKFDPNLQDAIDLKDYVKQTDPFSAKLTEELIDRCSHAKYNLVIEGTLRTYSTPLLTAKSLQEKGYRCQLEVLVVHEHVSYLDTIQRYLSQIKLGLIPRAVDFSLHKQACQNIPANLQALHQTKVFDQIKLVNRANKILLKVKQEDPMQLDYFYQTHNHLALQDRKQIVIDTTHIKNQLHLIQEETIKQEYEDYLILLETIYDAAQDFYQSRKDKLFFQSYQQYCKNNFQQHVDEMNCLDGIFYIGVREHEGVNDNFDVEVIYDLNQEVEVVTVINYQEDFVVKTYNHIAFDKYMQCLEECSYDALTSASSTGIDYEKLDELIELRNTNPQEFLNQANYLGLEVIEQDEMDLVL